MSRAAQSQAKSAFGQAQGAAGLLQGMASNASSSLLPFLTRELNAQHTLTPQQTGELMTEAAAGTGGAASGITGEAGLKSARTRNAAGLTGVEDQAARSKEQAMAKTGEGVAAKDIALTQAGRQSAARGLQGLYGVDTSGMLRAMGLEPQDINAEIKAGNSGWFQKLFPKGLFPGGIPGGISGAQGIQSMLGGA